MAVAWAQNPHAGHDRVIDVSTELPVPTVSIELHPDASGYNLHLAANNFRFTPENVNRENVPNEGHAHLYINGEKIARLYSEWHHLPRAMFRQGLNRVRVLLNANDHSAWGFSGEAFGADVLMDTAREGDPIVRGKVRYELDWDKRGVRGAANGWSVTNDLGYEIQVTAGRMVTRGIEMVSCHQPTATALGWLRPSVYAGHGFLVPDASRLAKPVEEDLSRLVPKLAGELATATPEYCQGHYLVVGLTIEGLWSKDGSKPIAFRASTPQAFGELKELPQKVSLPNPMRIRIVRPARMFDGIDFLSMNEESTGLRVLRSVVRGTSITSSSQE